MNNSSNKNFYSGVITALATPFLPDGSLDWTGFDRLLSFQVKNGIKDVVCFGTTGESPTLTEKEKEEILSFCKKNYGDKLKLIAGTGSNSTVKTIELTKNAALAGADCALVVTPFYNKPSQEGMRRHFLAVADESKIPIILYNVPGRTCVSLSVEVIAELAKHPNIIGIKEATGDLKFLKDILANVPKEFAVVSGDDDSYLPFLLDGGHGIISVASNVIPKQMNDIFDHYKSNKADAEKTFEAMKNLIHVLSIETNPVPVKAALEAIGIMHAKVRLPLAELRKENHEKLLAVWKDYERKL